MSEQVLTAVITGAVTVMVAIVGTVGVWLQRKPAAAAVVPKRRKADTTGELAQAMEAFREEQSEWRREVRQDLRKDLADAKAEFAVERQGYLRRIAELEDKVRTQATEIVMLRSQIEELQRGAA